MTVFFYNLSFSFTLRYTLIVLWLVLFSMGISAQNSDSIVSKPSLFIIPHPAYQQETSWSGGIAGGYYFKSNDLSKISSISGSADYTLLNQFIVNITPKIYLADKKWYLYSNLNFRNFPDFYYGIGNQHTNIQQSFTADIFSLSFQPQYALTKNIYVGLILAGRTERLRTDSTYNSLYDHIYSKFGDAGWKPYKELKVGILSSFDSRDNQFYPQKGIFAKVTLGKANTLWGSSYNTTDFSFDFRQFIPIANNHVLAWQTYFSGIFSKNEVPFQLLPTLGGRDLMRGFRQGMYRDNAMFIFQTEYRMPVYKRLKAALFLSTGDVMDSNDLVINKLKVAYGGGLRYRINDARVHLRVDIAKNNYGEKLQFYITATEAF